VETDLGNSALVLNKYPPAPANWREKAQRIQMEAHVLYFVFKNPRTRWYARLVAACSVGYVFSPIQLIPNFIPVLGFADDLLVLFLGAKLLRKITPPDLMAECRLLAGLAQSRWAEESAENCDAGQ
jgi:uncharacterized membrane protein YkvA (DUF1232 family)